MSKSCKISFLGKSCTRFYKGLRNIAFFISGDEDTCQNYNFDKTELEDDSGRYLDNLFHIYLFFQRRGIQLTCTTIFCLCSCAARAENIGKGIYFIESGQNTLFCGYKVVIKIPFFCLWFIIYWCWYFLVLTYGISNFKVGIILSTCFSLKFRSCLNAYLYQFFHSNILKIQVLLIFL